METSSLDLVCFEIDPSTNQQSASVWVKASATTNYAGFKTDRLLTSRCLNFVELDAEIRRLHAGLDEIRARAKKQFYKAEAAAAGAA